MKTIKIDPHKSSLGMDANVAALMIFIAMAVVSWIPYLGWIAWGVPLVFFFTEKDSKFVKLVAVQAFLIGVIRAAFAILFQILVWILTPRDIYSTIRYLTGRGWGVWSFVSALSVIVAIAISIALIYLAYSAWMYKQVEIPFIGSITPKATDFFNNIIKNQAANAAAPVNQQSEAEVEAETAEDNGQEDQ